MVDSVNTFSSTTDAMSVDCDAMKKRYADEELEHNTKRMKPRRKFHAIECECAECIERYGVTVVPPERPQSDPSIDPAFRETNEPTLPCLCHQCENFAFDVYPNKLDKRVNIFLRRTNNCTCTCGICRNCVSDPMYFKIISDHIDRVRVCECMFCENYRYTHERFGWNL